MFFALSAIKIAQKLMNIVKFEGFWKIPFSSKIFEKICCFWARFFHVFLALLFEISAGLLAILGTYFPLYSLVRVFLQKILVKGCPWGHHRVLHGTRFFLIKMTNSQQYTLKLKIKCTLNWSQGQEKNKTSAHL